MKLLKICQPFICLWGVKWSNALFWIYSGYRPIAWCICSNGNTYFRSLFQYLMELSSQKPFNLVIDEFQEFYNINESVYSDMQNIGIPIGRNLRWIWLYRVPFIRWCRKYFRTIKSPCSVELIISLNCLLLIWLHWKKINLWFTIPIISKWWFVCPSIF